ncbi:MAG TPA: transporter [Dyella sp.]|uniref:transporter n=1 Tax=Dyella sp. TaxID=1869338 RepID=UPI002D7936A2|nr:transporter [Dyella sp.]HET6553557.1 transporter [Dyella sp.]
MRRASTHHVVLKAAGLAWALCAGSAGAQELEPRSYSPSPTGTNFLDVGYTRLSGDVLTDPSLPVTDVQARINSVVLAYVRTFGLAGHSSSIAIGVPYVSGDLSGNVIDAPTAIHREGLGDLRLRLAYNIVGSPALAPSEFMTRTPSTAVGVSLTVSAPTGAYNAEHLVNIGTHRWSFKPEIGISWPMANWFLEASAGAYFFTDNDSFYRGRVRSQDPLGTVQLHAGYTFRSRIWMAADIGYVVGGRTGLDGVPDHDRQSNMRWGLTLSAPINRHWSAKFAVSNGLVTRLGGDYTGFSTALQYRWFDR